MERGPSNRMLLQAQTGEMTVWRDSPRQELQPWPNNPKTASSPSRT